jgi:polar amino acid transport system substrate-binding protein
VRTRPALSMTLALVALVALVALGACARATTATTGPPAQNAGSAPQAVVAQATPSPAPTCANALASAPPPAAMPTPGQMPAGSTMATIQKRGRLIVGVAQDQLLFGYLNPFDGQIEGFDVDVARQVAQAIFGDATKIQFQALTVAQRIPALQNGSVDMVADTFTITCARRSMIDFSSIYYDAGQRVLVPSDSTATGIQDLGGKKVCATAGSTSIANIQAAAAKPVPVALANDTDCLVALQEGTVDAISTDDAVLAGLAAQDPYAKIVGPRISDEPYGLGIPLGHTDFTSFVNGVLQEMRTNGTWTALYNKWLTKSLGPVPAPPAPAYTG